MLKWHKKAFPKNIVLGKTVEYLGRKPDRTYISKIFWKIYKINGGNDQYEKSEQCVTEEENSLENYLKYENTHLGFILNRPVQHGPHL